MIYDHLVPGPAPQRQVGVGATGVSASVGVSLSWLAIATVLAGLWYFTRRR